MKIFMITAGLTVSLCVALNASSRQAPSAQPQTPAPTQSTQRAMPAPVRAMSMTGCLYREWDVPVRIPNSAEKLEVIEGYIVADARIVGQGSSAPGHVGGTGGRIGTDSRVFRAHSCRRLSASASRSPDVSRPMTRMARALTETSFHATSSTSRISWRPRFARWPGEPRVRRSRPWCPSPLARST